MATPTPQWLLDLTLPELNHEVAKREKALAELQEQLAATRDSVLTLTSNSANVKVKLNAARKEEHEIEDADTALQKAQARSRIADLNTACEENAVIKQALNARLGVLEDQFKRVKETAKLTDANSGRRARGFQRAVAEAETIISTVIDSLHEQRVAALQGLIVASGTYRLLADPNTAPEGECISNSKLNQIRSRCEKLLRERDLAQYDSVGTKRILEYLIREEMIQPQRVEMQKRLSDVKEELTAAAPMDPRRGQIQERIDQAEAQLADLDAEEKDLRGTLEARLAKAIAILSETRNEDPEAPNTAEVLRNTLAECAATFSSEIEKVLVTVS